MGVAVSMQLLPYIVRKSPMNMSVAIVLHYPEWNVVAFLKAAVASMYFRQQTKTLAVALPHCLTMVQMVEMLLDKQRWEEAANQIFAVGLEQPLESLAFVVVVAVDVVVWQRQLKQAEIVQLSSMADVVVVVPIMAIAVVVEAFDSGVVVVGPCVKVFAAQPVATYVPNLYLPEFGDVRQHAIDLQSVGVEMFD